MDGALLGGLEYGFREIMAIWSGQKQKNQKNSHL